MEDDFHTINRVVEEMNRWHKDRDQILEMLTISNKSMEHFAQGQERIFKVLSDLDKKLSLHSERITRVEERSSETNEKIEKHKDEHWKQTALNISIIGVVVSMWKLFFSGNK